MIFEITLSASVLFKLYLLGFGPLLFIWFELVVRTLHNRGMDYSLPGAFFSTLIVTAVWPIPIVVGFFVGLGKLAEYFSGGVYRFLAGLRGKEVGVPPG